MTQSCTQRSNPAPATAPSDSKFDPSPKNASEAAVSARWLAFFERYPKRLRIGPWSPLAYVFLIGVCGILVFTAPIAITSLPTESLRESGSLTAIRVVGALHCYFVLYRMVVASGWFPLASYTMWSWTLLTLRFTFTSLFSLTGFRWAFWASVAVRFPALVGNVITVTLWWAVIFPVILAVVDSKKRAGFLQFNRSFLLVNVHLLNLPLVATEFLWSSNALTFSDLWAAFLVAFIYISFYLAVLDPRGFHLYIILTPRTHACILVYTLMLGLYCLVYAGAGAALQQAAGTGPVNAWSDMTSTVSFALTRGFSFLPLM